MLYFSIPKNGIRWTMFILMCFIIILNKASLIAYAIHGITDYLPNWSELSLDNHTF